jgi:hypothetical protein
MNEQADLIDKVRDSVLEYAEISGIDQFHHLLFPARPRNHIFGWKFTGLRSLFVSTDLQTKPKMFVTTTLHEYIHCWLSLRNFGLVEDQEKIVEAWEEVVCKWSPSRMGFRVSLNEDAVKNSLSRYRGDRCSLKNDLTPRLSRQLFRDYTHLFSRVIAESPKFESTFDKRYMLLGSSDKEFLLELEANSSLNTEHAGRAATCIVYGLLIQDLEAILSNKHLGENSYEEAVCYMLSCGITGESLENFFGMTDRVNISWATKLAKLGVQEVIGQILDAENVYARVRELVERSISE